jgi:hypothetical protein
LNVVETAQPCGPEVGNELKFARLGPARFRNQRGARAGGSAGRVGGGKRVVGALHADSQGRSRKWSGSGGRQGDGKRQKRQSGGWRMMRASGTDETREPQGAALRSVGRRGRNGPVGR